MESLIKRYNQDFEIEITQEEVVLKKYLKDKKEVFIPYGITIIGESAFRGNKTVEIITIPESVKKIQALAFADLKKLKYIFYNAINCQDLNKDDLPFFDSAKLLGNNKIDEIRPLLKRASHMDYSLFLCLKRNPSYWFTLIIGNQVKRIPSFLFCTSNVKTIRFEEGSCCKSIGKYAFFECMYLSDLCLPNDLLQIEEYAFEKNHYLNVYYNDKTIK